VKKATAFALLGGNTRAVAHFLGISIQAVYKWPEDKPLPRSVADRVLAARVRLQAEALVAEGRVIDPLEEDAVSV
jgi:hypothetical protein